MALVAFAQSVALRLNCDRALISILDDTDQYILAEATKTISLRQDSTTNEDGDELLYGTAIVPRTEGRDAAFPGVPLSDMSIVDLDDVWISSDVHAGETSQQRHLTNIHPEIRFYAVAPIRTPKEYNIGTICVVDNNPRSGISDVEKRFLADMARTVMEHLERARVTIDHQRSLKLFEALGTLMKYGTPEMDNSPNVKISRRTASSSEHPTDESDHPPPSPSSAEIELPAVTALPSQTSEEHQPGQASAIQKLFARSSSLLEDVSDAEGVVFFDAGTVDFRRAPRQLPGRQYRELDDVNPAANIQPVRRCDVLGANGGWGRFRSGLDEGQEWFGGGPREDVLSDMLRRYRLGGIFQIGEQGKIMSSGTPEGKSGEQQFHSRLFDSAKRSPPRIFDVDVDNKVQEILRTLPGARSVAFFPLWDVQRNRWYAAGFAWSTDPKARLFLDDDLTYLRAFGNCIMAAVAVLDARMVEMQKATFMSMMSHELRSPLHGILANIELFHDIKLQPFQIALLNTIEACGRTMLDVVNHLLDYTEMVRSEKGPKVNKSGAGNQRDYSPEDASISYGARDVVDLSVAMGKSACNRLI